MNFRKGNITMIFMKDFLTFDEIEVRPKPFLNIISGPNGNGKSTVLCGLCLGLGGKPSITGRGKDVSEYIKYDRNTAIIEVEIYVDGTSPNLVIRRTFSKKQNSWLLQGREVRTKDIEAKVKEVGIQIDNLCQFLPQDRVADFAKLNKIQLLENTEMAIGEELYKQHEILKESGVSFQKLKDTLDSLQHQHDLEVNKNARIKDQVENHKVKQDLESKIQDLQKRRMFWLYTETRAQCLKLKEERNQIKKKVLELIKMQEPLTNQIKEATQEISQLKAKNSGLEKQSLSQKKIIDQIDNSYDQLIDAIQAEKSNFKSIKKEEEKRLNNLAEFKSQLKIQEKYLEEMEDIDPNEIKNRLSKINQDILSISQTIQTHEHEKDKIHYEIQLCNQNIRALKSEQNDIQNISKKRIELLNVKNKPAYQAVIWLQKNKDLFRAPIHHPLCTQINLKDQQFAKYVESIIASRDHFLFICEDKHDMNEFKRQMDKLRLRVNIAYSAPEDCSIYNPPLTLEQIRRSGFRDFQCFLSEVIEAPPAILSFLCKNYGIHRIPVALSSNAPTENISNQITLFFIGDTRHTKRQSRYDKQWSTSISTINEARLLSFAVDTDRLHTIEQQLSNFESNVAAHKSKYSELEEEKQQLMMRNEKYREEKKNLTMGNDRRKQIKVRIAQKQKAIALCEEDAVDVGMEEEKMKAKVKNLLEKCVEHIVKKETFFQSLLEIKESHKILLLRGIMIRSNISQWEDELANSKEQHQELTARYTEANKIYENKNREGRNQIEKLQEMFNVNSISELTEEQKKELSQNGPQDLETTERQLADIQVKIDCLITADHNTVEEYRRREKVIADMAKELEAARKNVAEENEALDESRKEWLPKIRELTEEISGQFTRFMARLGCAGEVLLEHGENQDDFSKYGMKIRVKFRDHEELRELNAQHQSGGERSVSTAMFLLALQRLRPVPFRCIDEINQGMDPENERRMFKMLIESITDSTASQCFLVSPKLLPDLENNEFVNVMTVYNSKHTIPHRTMRFKKHLKYRSALNS